MSFINVTEKKIVYTVLYSLNEFQIALTILHVFVNI